MLFKTGQSTKGLGPHPASSSVHPRSATFSCELPPQNGNKNHDQVRITQTHSNNTTQRPLTLGSTHNDFFIILDCMHQLNHKWTTLLFKSLEIIRQNKAPSYSEQKRSNLRFKFAFISPNLSYIYWFMTHTGYFTQIRRTIPLHVLYHAFIRLWSFSDKR